MLCNAAACRTASALLLSFALHSAPGPWPGADIQLTRRSPAGFRRERQAYKYSFSLGGVTAPAGPPYLTTHMPARDVTQDEKDRLKSSGQVVKFAGKRTVLWGCVSREWHATETRARLSCKRRQVPPSTKPLRGQSVPALRPRSRHQDGHVNFQSETAVPSCCLSSQTTGVQFWQVNSCRKQLIEVAAGGACSFSLQLREQHIHGAKAVYM